MSRLALILLPLALLAAGATAAGCGEEDAELLPGETAREITANLDTVQRLADEGDCEGAEAAALQVSEQVEALRDVDRRLQEALRRGAARLNEVVSRCEGAEEEPEPEEEEALEEEPEDEEADEARKEQRREREAQRRERERSQQAREREREGGARGGRGTEKPPSGPPETPAGEGKGKGKGRETPPPAAEPPAGGVEPGSPVGEGE